MWLLLAIRNLSRNIRRTVAVLFTVALGTGALFSFDGFIKGVLKELKYNTIHANYGFGQIYTKGYRDSAFEDPTKHWISDGAQLEEFLSTQDGVEQVFPRVSFSALLKNGNRTVGGAGQGVDAKREASFFHSLNVEEGRMLESEEKGILLGRGLARALSVQPGDTVTVIATSMRGAISKDRFVVTGIFHTGSAEFDRRMFRIQLKAAQSLLKTEKIELVSLGLKSESDWPRIAQAAESAFPHLEAVPFHVLDKIYYQHSVDWLNAQFNVVQIIILSIVLLGIFNTISASILERKQEIGNLRANGESAMSVLRMIAFEGIFLAILGSLVGMALAYAGLMLFVDQGLLMPPGPGQTREFVVSFYFDWRIIVSSLALSSAAACIASCFAGLRIVRMPIAQLLRSH